MINKQNALNVGDTDGDLYYEIMEKIVPDFECSQHSYVTINLDYVSEKQKERYPEIIKLMNTQNINYLIILISW